MKSIKQIREIKSTEERMTALKERAREISRRCNWDYLSKVEWADIKTQDAWEEAKKTSVVDYYTGKFLIDALGGAKNTRPHLVAILLQLRLAWIEEYKISTAPELILLDFALLSYYHFLRANYVINNFQWVINSEMFDEEGPKLKYNSHFTKIEGFSSEEHIQKMSELLLPSLERFNKLFLRNLKALRDLKRSNAILNIGNVSQINIGEKQINIGKSV